MRRFFLTLTALFSLASVAQLARAQVVFRSGGAKDSGPRKIDDKPMARIWFSRISNQSWVSYTRKVAEEMGQKNNSMIMLGNFGPPNVTEDKPRQELKGGLAYLTKGLIPAPVWIQFKRVANEAAFRKEVMAMKTRWGGADTKLTGKGDRYALEVTFQQMIASNPPQNATKENGDKKEQQAYSFSIKVGTSTASEEINPDDMEAIVSSMTTYFRYNDGVMFEANAKELHTMKLPSVGDLTLKKKQDALDLYADVDLSRIPEAYRRTFWKAAEFKANSLLQQADEESDEAYAVRRRSGELSMAIAKAAMLDLDRVRVSLSFANGEEPLKLDVVADARDNSNLAKQLGAVSGGVSRFESLRQKSSPLTVASAWQMPENVPNLLTALFARGRTQLQDELEDDPQAILAIEDVFNVLMQTAEAGGADAIVKLGGDPENGFAVYGGLRINGAKELSKHLSTLLSQLPTKPENDIHVTRVDGREFLSFRLDEAELPLIGGNRQLPAQLNFTVAESCLWFSLGESNSYEILKEALADYRKHGNSAKAKPTAPFVLDAHLGDWLREQGEKANSPFSEVPSQALTEFEQAVHRSLAGMFSFSMSGPGGIVSAPKMEFRDSYLAKALKTGQDDLHIEIDASPKRVRATVELGEGIIKFFVARWSDVQGRLLENLQIPNMEELRQQAADRAEKSDG